MFHTPIVPRVRKRRRPAEAAAAGQEEVKFEDVRLYLVERKMGRSRRSFLTQLARSKGFLVEDVLRWGKSLHFGFHRLNRAWRLKAFLTVALMNECRAEGLRIFSGFQSSLSLWRLSRPFIVRLESRSKPKSGCGFFLTKHVRGQDVSCSVSDPLLF